MIALKVRVCPMGHEVSHEVIADIYYCPSCDQYFDIEPFRDNKAEP